MLNGTSAQSGYTMPLVHTGKYRTEDTNTKTN